MLTVRRRHAEWLRGFSSGATDYISKPINPPDLIERVVDALQDKPVRPADGSPEYRMIQAAIAGNRSAFQVLIERYRERLMSNVMPWTRDSLEMITGPEAGSPLGMATNTMSSSYNGQ
jgi:DNA-binding response OmpR family regulator